MRPSACQWARKSLICWSTWCRTANTSSPRTTCLRRSGRAASCPESTLTSHINAVRKAVGDSGEDQKLIRTIARKGFRFVGQVRQEQLSSAAASTRPALHLGRAEPQDAPTLALPDKPSIAVLPFVNLSGDPEQEYFADGIVEDIITALSRLRWLFVIARNSSFTYKGRPVDAKQVGRQLGVRYIVEGGVRRAANRVRITTQLIDAITGAHLWADRFDGTLDDIFDMQDQVATSVVGAIARRLEQAEIERSKRKPTENLDAYDLFLRGMASFYQRTTEANSQALSLFYGAIELDVDFASAYAMASWCYTWRKVNGWTADRAKEVAEGTRLARRAVELGEDDAVALARSGHALGHLVGDLDGGMQSQRKLEQQRRLQCRGRTAMSRYCLAQRHSRNRSASRYRDTLGLSLVACRDRASVAIGALGRAQPSDPRAAEALGTTAERGEAIVT